MPDEIRPFPPGIRASVIKAIDQAGVPSSVPFVVLARADNNRMFGAVKLNGKEWSFAGYLEKEYQHKLTYGVEAVWYPGKK